ncbi:hypothetical protein L6164_021626 [Bauhinia variegata]|uniref:Uncharacterized protein n=1 Tax=Bauhinia variegata TaxID=167791 RepID=A0ACB9MZQ7_BAUVA|nr:hypothetical protein L6164_021626 [Bauhinia variegata]
MHHYAHDFSLFDFNYDYSDPIINPFSHHRSSLTNSSAQLSDLENDLIYDAYDDETSSYGRKKLVKPNRSPPKHRHDGKSPLPLGMDWSPPPRKWDGRNSVWPHNPHTGWSYCVTVPSWVVLPESSGSDPVVFYRVQVGIQSPEGLTSTRVILRRFSDFLKLFSELKTEFSMKSLPPAPPKKILRIKNHTLLQERRRLLEDWMEKLLSDIDVSRSAPAAIFLELEAAARSAFHDVYQQISDTNSATGTTSSFMFQENSHISVRACSSSIASDSGNDTPYEVSELGTPKHGRDRYSDLRMENSTLDHDLINLMGTTVEHDKSNKVFIDESVEKNSQHNRSVGVEIVSTDNVAENTANTKALRLDGSEFTPGVQDSKLNGHVHRLSTESIGSDLNSMKGSETSNPAVTPLLRDGSHDLPGNCELPRNRDLLVAFPVDERQKLNRILVTLQQRLATAKTDVEDLQARLDQEMTARQFLMIKVKDLEVELETTRLNCKENMQQAVLTEKERFTQMQWDMEELRRKCLDVEIKLKFEEDGRLQAESTKASIIQENRMLRQELDVAREKLENLQKHHDEFEMKSKTDVKLLIKEVKSLRASQLELKQHLAEVMKEKINAERALQKEKQRMELSNNANAKLLHECRILQQRLEECSVNFLIQEEDKLIVDTSPSDALDLLATSDNRIGLLLAEAQLLAQDIENAVIAVNETHSITEGNTLRTDDELRKMLTHIFVDNASLRKQINSVIRCALNANITSEDDEDEEIHLRKTVLSKFLER